MTVFDAKCEHMEVSVGIREYDVHKGRCNRLKLDELE